MTRKPTHREAGIQRLCDEIAGIELANSPKLPRWFSRVNPTEQLFVQRATTKRLGKVYRCGWPDFLIENGEDLFCVEVKCGVDPIRPRQVATFSALERRGIRVYIWNPSTPTRLIPWAKYENRSAEDSEESVDPS